MANEITLSELKGRLSAEQLQAAELLVSNDYAGKAKKSYEDIADELGMSVRTLYNWRQEPDFIRYCAWISETKLDAFRATADAQLIKLIEGVSNNGLASIKALELFYKLNGRLIDRREVVQTEESSRTKRISDDELQRGLDELNDMLN
ncbi:phBC6A51 family helix-turn-helix protein [Peribacillus asahii]|uniref:phBC6A51 family helix-turn-helix protein n=1 Tax=Peribacillus asahii TaxID=228899 RepID=UPI0021F936F6|nr:phBC6A51 family helix-turn-helix protein [Peribacillus asahii]USK84778.1 helix-turn-helix domain-containing protein [Peribacillus asahii]